MHRVVLATLTVTASAIAAPVASPPLWVQVASTLDCPRPSAVLSALRVRLGEARVRSGEGSAGALRLRVQPQGRRGVNAVLEQGGVPIVDRTLEVDAGECAELAETLALVTETWLSAQAELAQAAPEPSEPPAPARVAAPAPEAPAPEAPAPEALAPEAPAPEAPAANSAGSKAPPAVAAPPSNASRRSGDAGASANGAAPRVVLALGAAVGASFPLAASASTAVLVRVGAELGRGPFRAGARGQFEAPSTLDSLNTISIRHGAIEAVVGVDVFQSGPLAVTTSLAGGADVLFVSAANYTRPLQTHWVEPVVGGGLRAEWRAFDSVGLTLAGDAIVALRRERFLADFGAVYTPRVRANVSMGAAWHLF